MSGNEGGGGMGAGGAGDEGEDGIGLSRTSALNNRYFEDKAKSRSLDNLLEGPLDMQVCTDSFLPDVLFSVVTVFYLYLYRV